MRFRQSSVLLLSMLAAPLAAQTASIPDAWRTLARADLDAAATLIRDNHPGAVPALGDTAFLAALASAERVARARVDSVRDWNGYVGLMQGFMWALGDKHLWLRTLQIPATWRWAGAVTALRGDAWVLVDGDTARAPIGGTLVACDGVPVDTLARRRLAGTRAVWAIEAQRITASHWLLIDEGNPFVPRPTTCTVRKDGAERSWTLAWEEVGRGTLAPRLAAAAPLGAAGFSVRRSGDLAWIGIQSLSARADAVVDTVERSIATIREAPVVVIDVRGNGGGNSAYADRLARVLYGEAYVAAVRRGTASAADDAECEVLFRASPGNLTAWSAFVEQQRRLGGDAAAARWSPPIAEMRTALDAGRPLTGPVCPPSARPRVAAASPPPTAAMRAASAYRGKVVLLTDHACFSSCLHLAMLFRELGAVHVGETTDAATHYMEVREAPLPSGLGLVSTLQKVALMIPPMMGPFRVTHPFGGSIADTPALERWISANAAGW